MSNSSAPIPRRVVGGVSVLLYPQGPYIDVAERIRIVHVTERALSVERGEVLQVGPGCWIYRTTIQVGEQRYIGDAEIHLGADPTSPDGTTPISCGQTSAVGQALEFAGFGNLRSVLHRLGQPLTLAAALEEGTFTEREHPRSIAEVQTVWLDQPYVPIAERIYQLYMSGTSLSMENCEILEQAGIWVYRATVLVGERRYLGDAEIFFDAPPGTPDASHPVSCAQILAVGNALALAGFGDVRSILERRGKDTQGVDTPPLLASADAVIRARQQGQAARPVEADRRAAKDQRQQIAGLCQRLGVAEPDYATLDVVAADRLIADLQTDQDELCRSAEEAQGTPTPAPPPNQPEAQGVPMESVVDAALVRQLKNRWRQAFQPAGDTAAQLTAWEAFKTHVCKQTVSVSDKAMPAACYEQLLATLSRPSSQPRASSSTPVRQAPRIEPSLPTASSPRKR